jgi:hypothetical protein
MKEAADWLEAYRRFWEGGFDRLDVYLRKVQAPDRVPDSARGEQA